MMAHFGAVNSCLPTIARYERLATFKPIAMPGGAQAVREPWRNLYAHIVAALGWKAFTNRFGGSEIHSYLEGKPRAILDRMIDKNINAPKASSCGRLFDAVAAALGLSREHQAYEGEAAACLEALANSQRARRPGNETGAYPFAVSVSPEGFMQLDPASMWDALLDDLSRDIPAEAIAARFHNGLAEGSSKQ